MTPGDAIHHLPHGPDFRFIDHLLQLVPGISGTAEYKIRGDEPFLRGHFPGDPLFPGVLLIEGAAQLAGVVAQCDPSIPPLPGLKLTAIRAAKILGTGRPGETILFEAEVTGRMNNLVQAQTSGSIAGKKILEATITLSGQTDITNQRP